MTLNYYKQTAFCLFIIFFIGFNTARKESCPPRIMTLVNVCDETQQKPRECNMNEEKMPQKEKEPPNQSFQSSSSSLLSDPYRTGVVNKGFSVSFLDLYSDNESNYAGRVSKETAPINQSAVSLETTNDLLPDTKANSQVAINSGDSETLSITKYLKVVKSDVQSLKHEMSLNKEAGRSVATRAIPLTYKR